MKADASLPRSVLFLCGMNAVRSPVAERLARRLLPASVFVDSAGIHVGDPDPFVEAVLAEEGLSMGGRMPKASTIWRTTISISSSRSRRKHTMPPSS